MSARGAGLGGGRRGGRPGGGRLRWVLFVLFVVMPLLELYVLIQVGQVIGAWWTIGLLVLSSIVGTWLMRREGSRAWAALRTALGSGRMPARELADGGLIVLGGSLLLTPGFVSDVLGIALVLPFTRPLFRQALTRVVTRQLLVRTHGRPGPGPEGPVVRGDVVDD